MVFRAAGAKTYKVRIDHPIDHRRGTFTTGCVVKADADDVERVVHRWQGRHGKKYQRLDVLDAILEKRVALPDAYEAQLEERLDELLGANQPDEPSVDLMPYLERFVAEKQRSRKGGGQAETYKKQLLTLYPEGLRLSSFNRKEVWTRLTALKVDAPTRNRYRSATSWFAKSLVMAELLERNFVREIEGFGENDPRLVYYEIADARRLIEGLAQPYAAIAALGLAFAAEWGAIERGLVGDVSLEADPVTARVRGSKRAWRDRVVPLVQELAWTLEFIRPALKDKTKAAHLLENVPEWRAIDVQRETARELEIHAVGEDEFGEHSLHDWRHTHAVALLRFGYSEQIVADHLGHENTTQVRERYGRFKPTKHDYAKKPEQSADVKPIKARGKKHG